MRAILTVLLARLAAYIEAKERRYRREHPPVLSFAKRITAPQTAEQF